MPACQIVRPDKFIHGFIAYACLPGSETCSFVRQVGRATFQSSSTAIFLSKKSRGNVSHRWNGKLRSPISLVNSRGGGFRRIIKRHGSTFLRGTIKRITANSVARVIPSRFYHAPGEPILAREHTNGLYVRWINRMSENGVTSTLDSASPSSTLTREPEKLYVCRGIIPQFMNWRKGTLCITWPGARGFGSRHLHFWTQNQ